MANPIRRVLRPFGLDLVDYPEVKPHWRNLVRLLSAHGVDLVLDVGANVGQYAGHLRAAGYSGRIVSFEPLSAAHAALAEAAAADPDWTVAPRMALGESDGQATINVSNESDMSSFLAIRADFLDSSPTSRTVGAETVAMARLESVFGDYAGPDARVFLKIDTQGYERQVLAGAGASLTRIAGLQLELSLIPLYEGEETWRAMIDRLAALNFAPYQFIPGYFSRHLVRMLQIDGVFFRRSEAPRASP